MSKYEVTAETGFDGHKLGEQFDAELDEDLEARAVERGSIKIVKETKRKEASDDA